jgi:hypothetical protein
MLIMPNTTGEPLAGLGEPSAELPAAPELDAVPAAVLDAAVVDAAAPALLLELDELPQAARTMIAAALAATAVALLLRFITLLLLGAFPTGAASEPLCLESTSTSSSGTIHRTKNCMQ